MCFKIVEDSKIIILYIYIALFWVLEVLYMVYVSIILLLLLLLLQIIALKLFFKSYISIHLVHTFMQTNLQIKAPI